VTGPARAHLAGAAGRAARDVGGARARDASLTGGAAVATRATVVDVGLDVDAARAAAHPGRRAAGRGAATTHPVDAHLVAHAGRGARGGHAHARLAGLAGRASGAARAAVVRIASHVDAAARAALRGRRADGPGPAHAGAARAHVADAFAARSTATAVAEAVVRVHASPAAAISAALAGAVGRARGDARGAAAHRAGWAGHRASTAAGVHHRPRSGVHATAIHAGRRGVRARAALRAAEDHGGREDQRREEEGTGEGERKVLHGTIPRESGAGTDNWAPGRRIVQAGAMPRQTRDAPAHLTPALLPIRRWGYASFRGEWFQSHKT
jgi:hypothetical protein